MSKSNNNKILLEKIIAYGHPNILGSHHSTLEITKENFLTPRGNCIIGIKASKGVADFNINLKREIQNGKKFEVLLKAGEYSDSFYGIGNQNLLLNNQNSIVFRTSSFISGRTALINCSKSSFEISRDIIRYLKNPNNILEIEFYINSKNE